MCGPITLLGCRLSQKLYPNPAPSPQAVLQTGGQLQLEVRPSYLVPDTNGFIDHLDGLRTLLRSAAYVLVVPLIGEALATSWWCH